MNPVLILTRNNLALTKKCVESVLAQDISVSAFVIDNGSNDGTGEWLSDMLGVVGSLSWGENAGVSRGWNEGIDMFLEDFEHCLVLNNDTILPSSFYRDLLAYDVPFVTGAETNSLSDLDYGWPRQPLNENPQFSAFLIRRSAWTAIGPFNTEMKNHASDCDYHVRAHRAGIPLLCANVPYYHERSSTLKNAPPKERREIELQADADRDVFKSIYECYPGDPAYRDLFK